MNPTDPNSHGDDDSFARELERQHKRLVDDREGPAGLGDERVESAMFVLRLLEEAKGQLDQAKKPTQPAGSLETLAMDDDFATPDADWRDWVPFQQVGRFEIVEPLGRGGFGIVFRGRDPALNRDVAIKVPR